MKDMTLKARIQVFGRFLSGMVMPNIGAFIAWGLITALFIPTGWWPNATLAQLVGPMITFLLPLLIGYSGGRLVGGQRGAVMGAIATTGLIVGADIPMFLGAMIVGPLAGWLIKIFDQSIHEKVPSGFEMLVNNFSIGFLGTGLALVSYMAIGPLVVSLNGLLESAVGTIVKMGLLPLASLVIEPAKILFLNNAINHGVLGPLGVKESAEIGRSIFFLMEANPGPGLGLLLAYLMAGKGTAKNTAPSAIIIHFFGGIHEIYFPFVLMRPLLLVAVILGGMTGVTLFTLLGVGLVATPSPGSIFALLAMAPKGAHIGVLTGVGASALVTWLVAVFLIKTSASAADDGQAFDSAKTLVSEAKAKSKGAILASNDMVIRFACDAGMGSSAMGATRFKQNLGPGLEGINIHYCAIDQLTPDVNVVVVHKALAGRVQDKVPGAHIIPVDNYLNDPQLDLLLVQLKGLNDEAIENAPEPKTLDQNYVLVGLASESKAAAIDRAGKALLDGGYIDEAYIGGMHAREQVTTTYIGSHVAIPHGTNETKHHVKRTGLVILQYPDGVDFGGGNMAHLVIGIAAKGEEHMTILSNIAVAISNEATLNHLISTKQVSDIYETFSKIE